MGDILRVNGKYWQFRWVLVCALPSYTLRRTRSVAHLRCFVWSICMLCKLKWSRESEGEVILTDKLRFKISSKIWSHSCPVHTDSFSRISTYSGLVTVAQVCLCRVLEPQGRLTSSVDLNTPGLCTHILAGGRLGGRSWHGKTLPVYLSLLSHW